MNAGRGKSFSREMSSDEVGVFLSLDEHQRLVLGVTALQDLSELLSFLVLGDLVELLHHVGTCATDHAHRHEQVAIG